MSQDKPSNQYQKKSVEYPKKDQEKPKCLKFLQDYGEGGVFVYREQLQEIANRTRKLLEISIDDIVEQSNDYEFVNNIKTNTQRYVSYFEEAADELIPASTIQRFEADIFDILQLQRISQAPPGNQLQAALDLPKSLMRRFEVAFIPQSFEKARRLREVKSKDIGHLVSVKGMVTRSSDVKPHISVCTYTCDVCGSEIYQEVSGGQFMPQVSCPSPRCVENKSGGRVQMQTRGSRFVKYQELRIQELPDQVPVGHIPRAMTIHCRGEQTRQCGPGDIVTIAGIFLTVKFSGFRAIKAGLQTDTFIEAHLITKDKLNYSDMDVEGRGEALVREIARHPDPYGRLASSIAPEIFGHEDVKKALLLQLVGGVTRNLADGMKIRGDINVCLMGDPGVAKSQLLKYIASVAPRGVYTTGKGSSGVGLTAAVVRDNVTGDMALEGGALVLADMGVCCIDEFDKMDENDRTAIHEVMEQQTVSIAKAGITTTLNARAAVLAAANPLYGRYNKKKSISENIDLPNSLLSRFDLLFLIIDKAEMNQDVALSKHVLHVHRYLRNPDKLNACIPPAAMKQYIATARTITPNVPKDLTSYIVEAYVSLRAEDAKKSHSARGASDQTVMTPRQLLSILRLSQSLARLRLGDEVCHEDVDEAIRLTHASKSSLIDDTPQVAQEDSTSAIYSMIIDVMNQRNTDNVNFAHIEAMSIAKGFTAVQLDKCLTEYEALGILTLNLGRTKIALTETKQ